jgi:ferritin
MNGVLLQSLQSQLNYERYSAEIYRAMAVVLDDRDLTGMANWMYKQADEENTHAKKFAEFILDRNETPLIDAIPKPEIPYQEDIRLLGQEYFQKALEHEYTVTERINNLFRQAAELDDPATRVLMHWFVAEQVEEERQLVTILNRFALASNDGAAILILDQEIGQRK